MRPNSTGGQGSGACSDWPRHARPAPYGSAESGAEYETASEVTIADGRAEAPVHALLAGVAGNLHDGAALSVVSPVAGLVSDAAASGAIAGGTDAEGDEALRLRLLFRIQSPPRGGTADDYVMWARAAHPDVTRAWATPLASGLGTVTIHFMTDDATGDGVPTTTIVDAVQDYIDARRPTPPRSTRFRPSRARSRT